MTCRVSKKSPPTLAGLARAAQDRGQAVGAAGDALQAFRPVVHAVHAGHHRQQHLRGADVAGRLLAADVLLAGLQGQAVGGVALGVDRDADQAAGHRALERVAAGHERRVRAAEAERHAEALAVADHDVGAPFARRLEQGQGQQVGNEHIQRVVRMDGVRMCAPVEQPAGGGRALHQHEVVALGHCGVESCWNGHFNGKAERLGAGMQDFQSADKPPHQKALDLTAALRPGHGSAVAVASSSSEALAMSMPERSAHICWS